MLAKDSSGLNLPSCARPFSSARLDKMACALPTMASSPAHALMTEFCNALAYEKDTCHGFGCWFMAFKYKVESNSDKPPDKNMIPAVAGGTREFNIFKVASQLLPECFSLGSRHPGQPWTASTTCGRT